MATDDTFQNAADEALASSDNYYANADFQNAADDALNTSGNYYTQTPYQQGVMDTGNTSAADAAAANTTGSSTGMPDWLNNLLKGGAKNLFSGAGGGIGGTGLAALLAALASYKGARRNPMGGGTATGYAGAAPLTRTMVQGRYGPYATYAAQGGLMQAYAQGGSVQPFPMQDGGFVMTKRAVDGAGGPQGMHQHVPEAHPIVGPGHGTSDSIPAYIQGAHGRSPARVSNGEMYVPPGRDPRGLQALMQSLERKA
jgi:hypothetical protein